MRRVSGVKPMFKRLLSKVLRLIHPARDVSDAGVARRLGIHQRQVRPEVTARDRHDLLDLLDKVESDMEREARDE